MDLFDEDSDGDSNSQGSGAADPLDQSSEEHSLDELVVQDNIRRMISDLTYGYTLSYRDIRDKPQLK